MGLGARMRWEMIKEKMGKRTRMPEKVKEGRKQSMKMKNIR